MGKKVWPTGISPVKRHIAHLFTTNYATSKRSYITVMIDECFRPRSCNSVGGGGGEGRLFGARCTSYDRFIDNYCDELEEDRLFCVNRAVMENERTERKRETTKEKKKTKRETFFSDTH